MTHFLQLKGFVFRRLPTCRGLFFLTFVLCFASHEAWAGFSTSGSKPAGTFAKTRTGAGGAGSAPMPNDDPPPSASTAMPDPVDVPARDADGDADDGAEAAAGAASSSPTDHFAHFLQLFEASCPHIPPFPLNFIGEGVVFDKGEKGSVKIFAEGSEELLEEFTVPEDLEAEGLRPYFMALKMAAVAKHPEALVAHARFRALLKDLARGNLLQELESAPLSPEGLIENFSAWVTSLRTNLVDPFDADPVVFIRHNTDNLEWMETVFRGWFMLADGAEVTGAQAATLIGSAVSLGEFLSAFTVKLFALFEDGNMGAWEEEFFQSAKEAVGDDAEVTAGLDFTPEEQRTHVRRRMLTIHQMIMQAYFTVEDMLGSLKIEGLPEEEDLKMKMLLYGAREVFTSGGTLHSNRQLVLAREGDIDYMAIYLDFMSTLVERSSEVAIKVVGHPLYRFIGALGDEENERRLGYKIQRLDDMLIPTVEAAVAYFEKEGQNYIEMIARLPVPDDIEVDHADDLHRGQALAKNLPIEYKNKYGKWFLTLNGGEVASADGLVVKKVGLIERLGQLKAQRAGLREALGLPKL